MFEEIKEEIKTEQDCLLTLIDSDFTKTLSISKEVYNTDPDTYNPSLWDEVVIAYEERNTDVAKNIFYALKKCDWFSNYPYVIQKIGWLFDKSKNLAKYREDIEKYLLLM
jgi:hypothetical protein